MSPENARKIHLNNISIVLHKPRFPENIGASARAMCNMGILRLIVIQPENFDMIRVLRMATQAAAGRPRFRFMRPLTRLWLRISVSSVPPHVSGAGAR
ncbi:tRNA (cytidine(32)/uridine(32)-2'-O)-methyltransferase (EC [Olavius algarvensis associated proteobacterium Delta 3]|nr:tRNA (cytidine(32)/uridine(32)-2'-O)-methyltransferase (EC [Olavius algarvensis associated proteobacterium Delta 3]